MPLPSIEFDPQVEMEAFFAYVDREYERHYETATDRSYPNEDEAETKKVRVPTT